MCIIWNAKVKNSTVQIKRQIGHGVCIYVVGGSFPSTLTWSEGTSYFLWHGNNYRNIISTQQVSILILSSSFCLQCYFNTKCFWVVLYSYCVFFFFFSSRSTKPQLWRNCSPALRTLPGTVLKIDLLPVLSMWIWFHTSFQKYQLT